MTITAARTFTVALLLAASCSRSNVQTQADQRRAGAEATPPGAPSASPAAPTQAPPPADPQPPPPAPIVASDGATARLVRSILALGEGPLGTLPEVTARLDLPPALRGRRSTTLEIPDAGGPATLILGLEPGTYEAPRGNSAPRTDDPVVISVELSGPGGLPSPAPEGARDLRVQARIEGGAPTSVQHWGQGFYFEQGREGQPWYLGRFDGRAPFHYSDAERRSLEDALIEVTRRLGEGEADLQAMFASLYGAQRRPDGVYDFGAGTIVVSQPSNAVVDFVGPMTMPRFFAAHGIRSIYTSFAHDAGQLVEPLEAKGCTIVPTRYFIRHPGMREAEMGEAADAKLSQLSISAVPGQPSRIRDVKPSPGPAR